MRRSAIDCLRRGALSTRANWPLVLLSVLQGLAVGLLLLISLVVPLVVIGGSALRGVDLTDRAAVEAWVRAFDPSQIDWAGQGGALLLGGVSAFILSLAAIVVWAWFQAGILGVLTMAERQAHPEAERRAGAAAWFRTFSWRDFSGWGARYLWRFFWFFHLSATIALVLVFLFAVLALGAGMAYDASGGGAAAGLGCGGAIPLAFLLVIYLLWYFTAQPALAREGGGFGRAAIGGLRIAGRRLGGALLIVIVLFAVSLVVVSVTWVVQLTLQLGLGLGDQLVVWITLYLLLSLVQTLLSSVVTVWGFGSFAALVAAEQGGEGG